MLNRLPGKQEIDPVEPARVAVLKIITELSDHNEKFEPQSTDWVTHLDHSIVFMTAAKRGLTTAQLYGLAIVKQHWNELPLDWRLPYNNDFWFYACLRSGRQQNRLEDLISAVEVFMLEGVKPFEAVPVPKRNQYGGIIPGEFEFREFDPLEIDLGKLFAVKSRAVNDQMTEKLWSMLVDPQITVTELQLELMGGTTQGSSSPDTSMKFRMDGPVLVVQEGAFTAELGEITAWDAYYENKDSLESRGIRRLMAVLGIKLDEEILLEKALEVRRTNGYETQAQLQSGDE
jgi:hypothetical protein